jgi:glutamate synthase domain-containing protein 3
MMTAYPSQDTAPVIDIHAKGVHYRDLNTLIREAVENGAERIELRDVHGQRYIGTNLRASADIHIYGTPGNDLGAFMNGPRITVYSNAQDGCGNTMNEGEIIVHGHAGDITGLSARGGRIFVREGVLGIGLAEGEPHRANFVGTGMHGGVIYLRGHINDYQLGKEVGVSEVDKKGRKVLSSLVRQFAAYFDYDADEILSGRFVKLAPLYLRPYGRLYAY